MPPTLICVSLPVFSCIQAARKGLLFQQSDARKNNHPGLRATGKAFVNQ
jgi:hypothetical protein